MRVAWYNETDNGRQITDILRGSVDSGETERPVHIIFTGACPNTWHIRGTRLTGNPITRGIGFDQIEGILKTHLLNVSLFYFLYSESDFFLFDSLFSVELQIKVEVNRAIRACRVEAPPGGMAHKRVAYQSNHSCEFIPVASVID